MKTYNDLTLAINETKYSLYTMGLKVSQEKWQSIKAPDDFWERLNVSWCASWPAEIDVLSDLVKPNLPWAEDHFQERISGIPHNPPPSSDYWPHNPKSQTFRYDEKYSHTYPERIWPRYAKDEPNHIMEGVRFEYGDLNDVIALLVSDIYTRQAFLPIWFPEDTGVVHGKRVPCTLGYHFIFRNGHLHITYYIRSCDYVRHFRDDIYMAIRLGQFILGKLKTNLMIDILPGLFTFHCVSLHCFYSEKEILKQSNM